MNPDLYTKPIEELLEAMKCDLWYYRQTKTWRATFMGLPNKSGEGPTIREALIALSKKLQ